MNDRLFILWFAGRGYILATLFGVLVWARMHSDAVLRWEFLILVALGMALRLWAGAHLGPHGNATQAQSPNLCASGPYRFSRNPLYTANILTGSGLILFANCLSIPLAVLTLILLATHHSLLVHWEEKQMLERWGDAYETYLHATPRWLGQKTPHPGSKNSAQWDKVWIWQGRNLSYTVLCVALIWGASKWR